MNLNARVDAFKERRNKPPLCFCCLSDLEWISKVRVNTQAVLRRALHLQALRIPKERWQVGLPLQLLSAVLKLTQGRDDSLPSLLQAAWLLKAVTFIDLTTLSGDDTPSNVQRLCLKAIQPVRRDLLQKMDMQRKGL